MSESGNRVDNVHVLARVLGPVSAFCVVVGSVIGSGIFLVPAGVAHDVPFLGGIILAWILGGLLSAAGALTVAELAAMMPRAGGPYVYLREAYGPLVAFLFGWVEFLLARTGAIATLAAAFARYFTQVVPPPSGIGVEIWQAGVAVSAIAVVVAVNVLGTRRGGDLQIVGTGLKLGGIVCLIALPFLLGEGSATHLSPFWPERADGSVFSGMMLAMVGILWAYDGWINITPLAEEVRDPEKNIPRSLIWGMGVLIGLYLAATLAYHYVLPLDEVAGANEARGGFEKAVAAVYCDRLLGRWGVVGISLLVMASAFISLNGNTLTGPRAYFAMARDGVFPASLGKIHNRFGTPSNAIVIQGIWATLLVLLGTALIVVPPLSEESGLPSVIRSAWQALHRRPLYDLLFTYVIFGENVFYLVAIASVFVLRARRPDLPRPYRTWGYPWTPALYVIAASVLLGNMLWDPATRVPSIAGLGIIASGIPAYLYFRRPR